MPGRPPSLRAISAFEAAARHQSFSKAAAELNLTHSAVSHAIRGLEERLGIPLFERGGRGVVLTEAGLVLAGRVRLGIGLLSDAFEARPWLERSKLVLSVLPAFASQWLVPRLPRFRALHPEIELVFQANWGLAALDQGEADLALRYGPGHWARLTASKLLGEKVFPVVSPDYPRPRPATPADLLDHELILHPVQLWGPWLAAAGRDPREPRSGLAIDDSLLILDAAAAGLGIALARSVLAAPLLDSGRLERLFDIEVEAAYAYWIVWNPSSPKLAAIEAFRRWIEAELA